MAAIVVIWWGCGSHVPGLGNAHGCSVNSTNSLMLEDATNIAETMGASLQLRRPHVPQTIGFPLFHDMKWPIIWMKPLKHGRNCQLCRLSTKPSCCCSCAIFCCSCTACLPGTGKRMILLGQTPSIRCGSVSKMSKPMESPGEHQNSWYMDVHPPKNGINRYWSIPMWRCGHRGPWERDQSHIGTVRNVGCSNYIVSVVIIKYLSNNHNLASGKGLLKFTLYTPGN